MTKINRLTQTKNIVLVICMALLAACTTSPPTPLTPPDAVTVQLKWVHQAQFAGFYIAQTEGYYAEENLDVNFVPGGIGIDIYDGVRDGEVDFSVVGADAVLSRRSLGDPIVALATTYRINPFVMVAFADRDIRTPADLEGLTVSMDSAFDRVQVGAMLSQFDLKLEDVNIVPFDNTAIQAFIDGDIDVINSFVAGWLIPLQEQAGDQALHLIWPGDFGVHFYSDTIVAHEMLIQTQPDLVLRFLRATLRGHKTAIENPELAVEASLQFAELPDHELQMKMMLASVPLIHTGEDQIGWMDDDVWQNMHDSLLEFGVLDAPLVVNDVYTMQFLEAIYEEQS